MPEEPEESERCATCGADASGAHAYCHFYTNGVRRDFCSPECAERALAAPAAVRVARRPSPQAVLQQLVDEFRWAHGG